MFARKAFALSVAITIACLVVSAGCAPSPQAAGAAAVKATNPRLSQSWYFAEGTTRSGFTEYVCILNPSSTPGTANFSYLFASGEALDKQYALPPDSRTTIGVNAEVPPESDVSISISTDIPVLAERPMYFTYDGDRSGGHDVVGATAPLPEWHFAEGTTRDGFDTYVCLQNPGPEDAKARLDYYLASGRTETRDVVVKARSRNTIATHEGGPGIGRHNDESGDFSLRVKTAEDTSIVAERVSYFNYRPYVSGGHAAMGTSAPMSEWYFAEGTTRDGFDTYLCLSNPGAEDAKVKITYFCGDGTAVERKDLKVAKRSRRTVTCHDESVGIGRHDTSRGDFSSLVESTNGVPVLAERPMYYTYRPFWAGGSDAAGLPEPSDEWYFAEGTTRHGYDTYLTIANPGRDEALVDITYFLGDGQQVEKAGVEIAPRSRFTVAVHADDLGIGRRDGQGGDVSTRIRSSNGVPVVAERPMYFSWRWRTMDQRAIASAWGWGNLTHGNRSRPLVALTFDCENGPGSTSTLLDVLDRKEVKATCFLLSNVAHSTGIPTRIAAAGHEFGNHGTTHAQFTKISADRVAWELANVDSTVNAETGMSTRPYFRFPYGEMNAGLVNLVNSLGYLSMYWSVDPQEWRGTATVQGVIDNVVGNSGPGSIVLMHDDAKTIAAIAAIIDGLRAKGLIPVTLTELLYPGP